MLEKQALADRVSDTTGGRYAENGVSLSNLKMNDRIDASTAKAFYSYAETSYLQRWWPHYNWTVTTVRNSFEQAFKIVSLLIEKGYLKGIRLKDFIRIVKEVEEEL